LGWGSNLGKVVGDVWSVVEIGGKDSCFGLWFVIWSGFIDCKKGRTRRSKTTQEEDSPPRREKHGNGARKRKKRRNQKEKEINLVRKRKKPLAT